MGVRPAPSLWVVAHSARSTLDAFGADVPVCVCPCVRRRAGELGADARSQEAAGGFAPELHAEQHG